MILQIGYSCWKDNLKWAINIETLSLSLSLSLFLYLIGGPASPGSKVF